MTIDIREDDEITIDSVRYKIEAVFQESSHVPKSSARLSLATETATVHRIVRDANKKITGFEDVITTLLSYPIVPLDPKLRSDPALGHPLKTMKAMITNSDKFVKLYLIDKSYSG